MYFSPTYFNSGYFPTGYWGVEPDTDTHPFKEMYPEFTDVDNALIDRMILRAEKFVAEAEWGHVYTEGLYALTAHFLVQHLVRTDPDGGWSKYMSGKISSQKVGDVQVSFKTGLSTGFTEDWYQTTPYGADYWNMLQIIGDMVMVCV